MTMSPTDQELRDAIANSVPLAQSGGVSIVLVPTDRLDQVEAIIRSLEALTGAPRGRGGGSNIPVGVPAAPKLPASRAGRLVDNVDTYAEVVTWEISDIQRGELNEVTFTSDKPANTLYRLVIAGKEQWTDRLFQNALTVRFAGTENELPPNTSVVLQARTNDVAETITVDGEISGTEQAIKP